ncbi:MAG: hypothetical protein OJF61_000131 [Rhodanobacteraceae bacterium]|nr:MAG: hypothetical protein OJF61_000131 [Rhodanobacteraceae bacterium]
MNTLESFNRVARLGFEIAIAANRVATASGIAQLVQILLQYPDRGRPGAAWAPL